MSESAAPTDASIRGYDGNVASACGGGAASLSGAPSSVRMSAFSLSRPPSLLRSSEPTPAMVSAALLVAVSSDFDIVLTLCSSVSRRESLRGCRREKSGMPYAMFWMRERSDLSWSRPCWRRVAIAVDASVSLLCAVARSPRSGARSGCSRFKPALRVAQRFDAHVRERLGLRRHGLRRGDQVLLAFGDLAERELRLAELEARGRSRRGGA